MNLTILYNDNRIEKIPVKRVSNISTNNPIPLLYYERPGDMRGKGKCVRMSEVKCWEVEVIPVGGNLKL